MKHDYSIFTKAELVTFLNKYGNSCFSAFDPFNVMIGQKMDDVIEKKVNYIIKINNRHKKWIRLNNEYEKLRKLRFGEYSNEK